MASEVTRFDYDALNRPTLTWFGDGESLSQCYVGNTSCAINPEGEARCQIRNEHGQLVHSLDPAVFQTYECLDYANTVASLYPAENPTPVYTFLTGSSHYRYDPFGALLSIVDPSGNITAATPHTPNTAARSPRRAS